MFLGLGTQRSRLIPIEGVHQSFVLGGIDFLRDVRSGEPVSVGPRVIVIGGGNIAIDVALTALRQGATHVDMVSLENRREMPASPPRDRERRRGRRATAPGLGPGPGSGRTAKPPSNSASRSTTRAGKFDPKFDAARLLTLEGDHVILATGQGADLTILDGSAVETTHGFVLTDPKSLIIKVPGLRRGRRRARPADGRGGHPLREDRRQRDRPSLRGTAMDPATGTPVRRADVVPLPVKADERTHLPRSVMPERTVEEVLGQGDYVQIEEGLTDAMAHDEARRYLRCDVCIGCGLCMAACSEMGVDALRMADTNAGRLAYFDFTRPAELCIGCGACSQVCPTGAIRIDDQVGLLAAARSAATRRTSFGAQSSPEPSCANSPCSPAVNVERRRRRPRTGSSSAIACRITWRPSWIASSARRVRGYGPIVPQKALPGRALGLPRPKVTL